MGDLARGTTANYRTGWAHWLLWTLLRHEPPFPPGDDPFSMRLYEEELLGWGVWEFFVMQNSAGTVKGKWMAVRYENIVQGLRDPLKWRPRSWRAYGYMKR